MATRREQGRRLAVAAGFVLALAATGPPGTLEASGEPPPVIITPGLVPPKEVDPDGCKPVYPRAAKKAHREGTVVAEYTVTAAGRVKDVEIKRSAPGFDAAVRKALAHCRFHPATDPRQGGKAIAVIMVRKFRFVLPHHAPEATARPKAPGALAVPGMDRGLGATMVYQDGSKQCGIIARLVDDGCVVAWVDGAAGGGPTHVSCSQSVSACGTSVYCGCGAPGMDDGDDATRRGSSLDFAVHTGPGQHTEAFLEVQPGGCRYHESFFDAEGVGDGLPTFVHCGKPVPDLASWDGELTCDCP